MSIFPTTPRFPPTVEEAGPVREWVLPSTAPQFGQVKACVALPPGMPDCLEVSIVRSGEGTERTTAVIYGRRAILIHYAFMPN
ncbi:hypothetical protein [Noviherbaspirillum sp. ST9]|uniref:hypothetical protein n=1 Tax=Noviherbaspirillum sp. ST9 TaxID=3401606 RepID=UPI003B588831